MPFHSLQDKFIFQSVKLDRNYSFDFSHPFVEHFIQTNDSEEINVLHFKTPSDSKGLILYFHGNADNLKRWGNYAEDFTKHGYDVVMMDYRSFGKSSGKPSELALYRDAQLVWDWAKENIAFNQLIIYGRSLGTAVASHLAIRAQPQLLILETPFDKLRGALLPILRPIFSLLPLSYSFPTINHISNIKSKTIIFHGTHDRVVPISSALRLRPQMKEGDEFVIINNGRHRNLRKFEEYHSKLAEILK